MKNGRALKGHRRVTEAIGASKALRQTPPGGWNVGCICGWSGGNWPNTILAHRAYREHLDYQIDQCAFKCKRCGAEKPASEMRHDYRYICLKCSSQLGNERQRKNPLATKELKRKQHLMKAYGITPEEAEAILVQQQGLCAICETPIGFSGHFGAHIDHNHATGEIRGLLCFNCNSGLGSFKDDPGRLTAALQYLATNGIVRK